MCGCEPFNWTGFLLAISGILLGAFASFVFVIRYSKPIGIRVERFESFIENFGRKVKS